MKKIIAVIIAICIITLCSTTAFAKTAFEIGDTDRDGVISITDATAIQLHLVNIKNFDNVSKLLADVDGDGVVTIMDATYIQEFLASHIDRFPADKESSDTPSLDNGGYNNEVIKP